MSNIADKELELMQKLINFGNSNTVSTVSNKPILEYHMKGADGKTYGIIRECNKFYIKVAPPKDTEPLAEDYNYIGGINNKKEYEYPTYALASKQFDLKMMSLNEAYISNKQTICEDVMKSSQSDWQVNETKEMRAEIERFNQITRNVDALLNEEHSEKSFTMKHTLPEAPAKNPSDKQVNSPYTDTAVASGDKDFKKELSDHEKAGKPYDKDGKATDADMQSDKNEKGEKGEVYTNKAKYVPDNSVADKRPSGANAVKMNEGKRKPIRIKVTEEQVLAWNGSADYMDKSHGTEIGDTAPYTDCACQKGSCSCEENKSKNVNEGYYDEPQSPEEVVERIRSMRSNIYQFDDGDYVYIDYDPKNNLLIAGGATNTGIVPDYKEEYDFDYSFDQNLQNFIETIEEQRANEGMGESCKNKGKKVNEDSCDVMHNNDNQNCPTPGNGEIGDGQPFEENPSVNEENIDVNDVAGMPDEDDEYSFEIDDEELPFPDAGFPHRDDPRLDPESTAYSPADYEFDRIPDDEEWGFADDEDLYGESKKRNCNESTMVLNDFGKHPAYQKQAMTTPPNKEVSKIGHEWDDESAQGEEPYGKQIGSNAPYTDKIVDLIADAVLAHFGAKKKS